MRLPDFYIIGAMKCATSMLQQQLANEERIFMCEPKEPNFFSDEEIFAKGMGWYENLFVEGQNAQLIGEASTHYTKWPVLPMAPARVKEATPDAKFIYMVRHPVDRLISQYLHEWSMRKITVPIGEALKKHPELVQYSMYAKQLEQWFQYFPKDRFLILTQEGVRHAPAGNYARVTNFLGYSGGTWKEDMPAQNVTSERLVRFPGYDFIMENRTLQSIRRAVVPSSLRQAIAKKLRPPERPELGTEDLAFIASQLGPDLNSFGELVGVDLTIENFAEQAKTTQFAIVIG